MLKKKKNLQLRLESAAIIAIAAATLTLLMCVVLYVVNFRVEELVLDEIVVTKIERNSVVELETPRVPVSTAILTIEAKTYQFLRGLGYDDEACAGIMGNLQIESMFKANCTQNNSHDKEASNHYCYTNCYQSGGGNAHGLVQWDYGRRDSLIRSAINNNVEWIDIEFQFEYIKNELKNGYSQVRSENIYNSCSGSKIEWACYRWCRYYEVCAGVTGNDSYSDRVNYSKWSERLEKAHYFYEEIKGGAYDQRIKRVVDNGHTDR